MGIDIKFFEEDATNQLHNIEMVLSALYVENNKENVSELFRAIHTLKGAAGMFGFQNIVSLTHKAEDLLDKIRSEQISFDSSLYSLFIEVRDVLEVLIIKVVNHKRVNEELKQIIFGIETKLLKKLKSYNIQKKHTRSIQFKIDTQEVIQNKKTILFVDDASMIRNIAAKTAESAGYNVITAEDGLVGLEKLENNKVDLLFSDVNMPQMGGLEMVTELRKNPKYEFLPIVMLTTEKKEELKMRGKALGVKAWLVKPLNKNKLLVVFEKLLG